MGGRRGGGEEGREHCCLLQSCNTQSTMFLVLPGLTCGGRAAFKVWYTPNCWAATGPTCSSVGRSPRGRRGGRLEEGEAAG